MTAKEKMFCEYFVKTNNAKEAAIMAGYSEKTAKQQAYQIKQRAECQEYIEYLRQELLSELGINKFNYMIEYNKIAKSNIKDYYIKIGEQLKLLDSGETYFEPIMRLKNIDELTPDQTAVIKRGIYDHKGNVVGYEFYDKTKALSDMIKIFDNKHIEEPEPLNSEDIKAFGKIVETIERLNNE